MKQFAPLQHLLAGMIAYAVVLAARKALHVELGTPLVTNAINGLIGFAVAAAMKKPAVKRDAEAVVTNPVAQALAERIVQAVEQDPTLGQRIVDQAAAMALDHLRAPATLSVPEPRATLPAPVAFSAAQPPTT